MTPPPQDTLVSRKLMTGYARDFTGRECTEMSFEIVLRHGAPRVIITDRGAVFRSRLVSSLVDLCNIDHRFTTAYHPQTNGLTERFNKTLADMLSMYVDVEQKNWDEILPFVTFAYNTAKQETTGFTPFYLLHGREAETTLDTMLPFCPNDFDDNNITKIAARAEESRQLARVHTLRAQDKDRRRYDSKHQMVSYAPGDLVWVYTPVRKKWSLEKLLRRYFGPYQVLSRLSAVTYEVQDFDPASRKRKLREVVHVLRMKPYHDPAEQIETEDIPPKESYKGPITRSRIKTLEQNDSGRCLLFPRGAMPHAQFATSPDSRGNENYTGIAARDTGSALKILTKAVRGVAATSSDRDVQVKIIDNARDVLDKSTLLIQESQRAMNNPSNPDIQQRLTQVAKSVSTALNNCVNCLPGQKDVDDAIKSITETSQILNSRDFPQTNKSYGELQSNLSNAAANLNVAASDVVASSKGSPSQLATSSKKFGKAFNELMDSGVEMIGGTKDAEIRGSMVVSLKNVSMVSSKLLVAAKSVAADPGAPNAKNQLAAAARSVTESINNLINVCTSATPGQKECDNAIRNIQSLRPLLDNPVEPISDLSYYECLDGVTEKSKNLGVGMTGIANYAKVNDQENFGSSVNDASNAVCGLVEAAAQAAYLVGVSDPSSVAGRQGLVDVNQFARANQAIQTACQQLTSSASKKQQVLAAATVIAQHTSALCNSCRIASSKTSNPVAKRHFVQSAKDVANATANLVKEIKALDQEPTDKNRQNTSSAIKPLVEAVENLTTFASSAEFASVPAKISAKAKVSQEPITSAGKSIIDGSCNMIMSAKSLVVNPKDPPTWQTLANNSKNVSDSIKKLVASIKDKAPGQKECDAAIEKLSTCIRELDRASLSIISQNLEPRTDYSLKGYQEQMETSASEIMDRIDGVRNSAKGEAEKLGHLVTQMTSFFEPLVQSAIGSASKTLNSKQQMALLDQTKTVAESALQLIYASKEAGGNPKATHIYCELDESADGMKDALHDLLQTLEAAATEAGVVTGLVDTINKSIVKVDEHTGNDVSESSFVDYQTRMVTSSKEIAKIAQDMIVKSTTDAAQLGPLAAKLAHLFANVAGDTRGAVASTSNLDVANRIKSSVQDLGSACIDLTKAAGSCQSNPTDTYSQRDVSDNARTVTEKVSFVLAALQAGSRGTQACINAASTVSGIIGDLDTTIMFATAGTLHAENEKETFSDHRENILKTAKALVEDTKTLVAGAASSQEQLAVAAQNAVTTIIQLAEVVKLGAASLGANNSDAQVLLINAVKDVATALGDLVQATKAASGKSIHDPAMIHLRDSAKVVRESCTSDEWLQSDQEDELIRLLSEQSEAVDDIDTTPLLVH
ncbi:talin-2 [Trichonephila clavipes]|uniref:Talin-2 n=1 Tax=Trichonephila clavipes TaxID=2585209 RepID=A0A8X6VMD0_TRICX|nr:talin-2 [Trichonephila clavipes]